MGAHCTHYHGPLADGGDCAVTYKRGDRPLAVATISRDLQSLRAELTMESEGTK